MKKYSIHYLFLIWICILLNPDIIAIPTAKELAAHFDNVSNEIHQLDITIITTDTVLREATFYGEHMTPGLKSIKTTRIAISDSKIRFTHIDKKSNGEINMSSDVLIKDGSRMSYNNDNTYPIAIMSEATNLSRPEQMIACEYFSCPMIPLPILHINPELAAINDIRQFLKTDNITLEYVPWNGNPEGGIQFQPSKQITIILDSENYSPVLLQERSSKGFLLHEIIMEGFRHIGPYKTGLPLSVRIKCYEQQNQNEPFRILEKCVEELKINDEVSENAFIIPIKKNTVFVKK